MATLDKQHTGRRQTPKNEKMSNRNTTENCGWTHQLAKGKQFRFLYICINGVSSNPVEGRTTIWQLWNLILTLLGLIFQTYIRLKIKPNSVRIRSLNFQICFLPSMGFELTPFWFTAAPIAYPFVQHPRPLDHIRYIYIYNVYIKKLVKKKEQDDNILVLTFSLLLQIFRYNVYLALFLNNFFYMYQHTDFIWLFNIYIYIYSGSDTWVFRHPVTSDKTFWSQRFSYAFFVYKPCVFQNLSLLIVCLINAVLTDPLIF